MRSANITLRSHMHSNTWTYQLVWTDFIGFLSSRGLPLRTSPFPWFVIFLIPCQDQGSPYGKVAVYKCAPRHPPWVTCPLQLKRGHDYMFMRGVFMLRPPQVARPLPSWSLEVLLTFLKTEEFEPLHEAPFKRLIQKTLCLLLASGRRIGEISMLSRSVVSRDSEDSLEIPWVAGYVPKVHTPLFASSFPSILRLHSTIRSHLLHCPVRACSIYMDRASSWMEILPPSRRHSFFWSYSAHGRKIPRSALTKLFISLVLEARGLSGDNSHVPVGPHQMRKLAASYAVWAGQDEQIILSCMGFSSGKIFRKNYVAEVPPLRVACVLPGGSFIPRHTPLPLQIRSGVDSETV